MKLVTDNGCEIQVTNPVMKERMMAMVLGTAKAKTEEDPSQYERNNKGWTEDEEQLLIDAHAQGKKPKEIGLMLGRRPASISTKIWHFKKEGRIKNGAEQEA